MQLKKVKDLQPGDKVAFFSLYTSDLKTAQRVLEENTQGIADIVDRYGLATLTDVRHHPGERSEVRVGPSLDSRLRPEWYVVVSE